MFRTASSSTIVRVVSSALAAIALAAAPVDAQQLGRTWHREPVDRIGCIFDATSQVGLVVSGALKVAHWSFSLTNESTQFFRDGDWQNGRYCYVDRVGDLRMSVVRTQSGSPAPANFVAADLDFRGQRILTRRSSAAGAGSVAYSCLLNGVTRQRTMYDSGGDLRDTWTGAFEVSVNGNWNLAPTDASFTASGLARLRQGSTYFWGSNRNLLGIGDTVEIWGGYSPVTMRAAVAVTPSRATGTSELWADWCWIKHRRRSYSIFQIPNIQGVDTMSIDCHRAFEQMM